jgi:hypothetical protein
LCRGYDPGAPVEAEKIAGQVFIRFVNPLRWRRSVIRSVASPYAFLLILGESNVMPILKDSEQASRRVVMITEFQI